MKKLGLILMLTLFVSACASAPTTDTTQPSTDTTIEAARDAETGLLIDEATGLLKMTMLELAQFDGQNGHKAFVSVDGQVYDVSGNRKWRNGTHENGIVAGVDVTDYMSTSPHGTDILKEFTIVGMVTE